MSSALVAVVLLPCVGLILVLGLRLHRRAEPIDWRVTPSTTARLHGTDPRVRELTGVVAGAASGDPRAMADLQSVVRALAEDRGAGRRSGEPARDEASSRLDADLRAFLTDPPDRLSPSHLERLLTHLEEL